MESLKISIMGCGWLGLPLAKTLVELGYRVNGSTTTSEKLEILEACGINPFLVSFPEIEPKTLASFLDADVLIFNIPPSKTLKENDSYESIIQQVIAAAPSQLKRILFVSSTSVYPDLNREVTETDAPSSNISDNLMLRSEHLFQLMPDVAVTVLRFGGLMGGQRHPGRWLTGKTDVPQPNAPVNMIHLADCIHIITEIIRQDKWGFTFNACAPLHPNRKDFYTQAAELLQLTPPTFKVSSDAASFKSINSTLLQQELSYTFKYPDPLTCLSDPAF